MPDFSTLPDIDAGRSPIVRLTDTNEAMADSRDVAIYFDKRHADVLRNIRELHCTPAFRERNFAPFKINDLAGEGIGHVTMTKNGFTFLAMGFTGAKSAFFKERYIEQFDIMESELRKRAAPPPAPAFAIPTNLADALQFAADQAREMQRQQAVISTMTPKAEFVDRFVESEGLYRFRAAGKALGCMPQKFCDWLRGKYCFPKGDLEPYSDYLNKGIFVARNFTARNGHAGVQYFVTPKGIEFFSTKVPDSIKPHHKKASVPALAAAATAH